MARLLRLRNLQPRARSAETDVSQTVTNRYHYLPYGGAYGSGPVDPGFTGQVMDPSGLVYMQAR